MLLQWHCSRTSVTLIQHIQMELAFANITPIETENTNLNITQKIRQSDALVKMTES